MPHQIPSLLAILLSVWWFQMPPEGLSFAKMLAIFGMINVMDSLIQNTTSQKIVCLC